MNADAERRSSINLYRSGIHDDAITNRKVEARSSLSGHWAATCMRPLRTTMLILTKALRGAPGESHHFARQIEIPLVSGTKSYWPSSMVRPCDVKRVSHDFMLRLPKPI